MSKDALTVLREARELISTPEMWTQRRLARDARGQPVNLYSDDAVCWCAEGAIHRACSAVDDAPWDAMKALAEVVSPGAGLIGVFQWNDAPGRTHAEVLAAFDKAIANLEAQA